MTSKTRPRSVEEALAALRGGPTDPFGDLSSLRPGEGGTAVLWDCLTALGAADLGVARAVEPHLDALAILDQAGPPARSARLTAGTAWGVFAAEGPAATLTAHRATSLQSMADGGWRLDGDKPWCSLGTQLDAALVTAALPGDGGSALFAVDLRHPGVSPLEGAWVSRGLQEIRSTGLHFAAVPAEPVGAPGWYLERPGFWWGGIGVAACWFGGALGLARRVFEAAAHRPDDPLLALHLGRLDERLFAASSCLELAAPRVDASGAATRGGRDAEPGADRAAGGRLARRVRAVVAAACEEVLQIAAHALGPGPLTQEAEHAKREADLRIYLRQQHAERDSLALGRDLLRAGVPPW